VRSRILALRAIRDAVDITEAEDAIKVLMLLYERRPWHFPAFLDSSGYWELRVALADLYVENGRTDTAEAAVRSLEGKHVAIDSKNRLALDIVKAKVFINRYGTMMLDVL
jgi:hypothetical protein